MTAQAMTERNDCKCQLTWLAGISKMKQREAVLSYALFPEQRRAAKGQAL